MTHSARADAGTELDAPPLLLEGPPTFVLDTTCNRGSLPVFAVGGCGLAAAAALRAAAAACARSFKEGADFCFFPGFFLVVTSALVGLVLLI